MMLSFKVTMAESEDEHSDFGFQDKNKSDDKNCVSSSVDDDEGLDGSEPNYENTASSFPQYSHCDSGHGSLEETKGDESTAAIKKANTRRKDKLNFSYSNDDFQLDATKAKKHLGDDPEILDRQRFHKHKMDGVKRNAGQDTTSEGEMGNKTNTKEETNPSQKKTNAEKEVYVCQYCPIYRANFVCGKFKYRGEHYLRNAKQRLATALSIVRFSNDVLFPAILLVKTNDGWSGVGCHHMVHKL